MRKYLFLKRSPWNQTALRWQEVPRANSYTVTVEEGGQVVWQTEVSQTQVVYAGKQSLQSAKEYLITVTADTGAFYISPLIKLLDEAAVQQLRAAEAEIQQALLDDVGKGIAIANVYLEYGLQSEALLLLEESVINKVQTGLNFNSNGDVQLTDSGIDISTQGGEAIATGTINVSHSGGGGGDVGIFGNRLALINTNVDASGSNGGGNVFVGGDYQGKGNIPTHIWQQEGQIF
ncbi:MAG: hypothetical protein WA865_19660 [Spirulinaceae cyanobacterium]